MAQRLKTSQELKQSGARAGRIAARLAEEGKGRGEKPIAPDPMTEQRLRWTPYLREAIVKEKSTFAERIVPGKTICLELGKRPFNWREDHPLTMAREYANQTLNIPIAKAELPILREECNQFLAELDHVDGYFMDPVAADSLELMFNTFDGRGWICSGLALFDFVQFMGWKKPDGSRRFGSDAWLHYKHRNVLAEGIKLSDELV